MNLFKKAVENRVIAEKPKKSSSRVYHTDAISKGDNPHLSHIPIDVNEHGSYYGKTTVDGFKMYMNGPDNGYTAVDCHGKAVYEDYDWWDAPKNTSSDVLNDICR